MPMRKGPATLKDIAKQLNVSISTVSKALGGSPEISKDTRKAVQGLARQMDYEPNQVAQNLRRNKTSTLGMIVPELATHFFAASLSGFQEVAAAKGYNVMICQSNECYEEEIRNIDTLVASRVDGLIISLSKETSAYDHLRALFKRGIPLVFFDRVCDEINTSRIMVDDKDGAFKATEHLIQGGYQRIAHLSGPEKLSISKHRLDGYLEALRSYQRPVLPELIRQSNLSTEDVIHQVNALLNLPQPPDALFAFNDQVAIQALQLMKARGISVPENMALVGFNNDPLTAHIEPSLTTVAQPAYQLGQLAARHILEQINHPDEYIPHKVVLKTELIVRDSSRPAKQS
jgi:LacI family transcriptional regulator